MNHDQMRGDDYRGRRPVAVPTEELRRLSVVNGYRAALNIFMDWATILVTTWLAWKYLNPVVYILAVFVIASRQHALLVLMHDGAHFLLMKNKSLNDWISDIFTGWPIFASTAAYRFTHWVHHRYTNTIKDPDCALLSKGIEDWSFPMSWGKIGQLFLKDFTGFSLVGYVTVFARQAKAAGNQIGQHGYVRAAFYLAILIAMIMTGFWKQFLLFWMVPFATAYMFLTRMRLLAEHLATENNGPLNITRTTLPNWWERPLMPHNANYHLEHHLFPSVPFYRLGELHAILMEQESFKKHAHVTQSYLGVLKECVQLTGYKRTCLQVIDPQTTD